ncbi:MAG: hypothetical protein GY898_01490 [Proteobacteria bacterium]|nr:hypothetical protein [Pseudomonadota bacterium]
MRLAVLLLLAYSLTACPTTPRDDDDAADSNCDGEQDLGEFYADESYDADADGFFDADDPGCAEFYDAAQLDCDDTNDLINPDEAETECNDVDDDCDADTADSSDLDADGFTTCEGDCNDASQLVYPGAPDEDCNGVDEDCNGDDGEPCDTNYSGDWTLTSAVTYACTGWEVDFAAMTLNHVGDDIAVSPDGCGSCAPTNLQGSFNSDTQFVAGQTVPSGNCNAEFSMLGTFTNTDSVFGNLSINFTGSDCGTNGCVGQVLSYEATR